MQPLQPPSRASSTLLPDAQHLHDVLVGVEDRGIAVALADDPAGGLEEAVRGLGADVDARLGLQQVQLVDDLQDDVADLAHAACALRG